MKKIKISLKNLFLFLIIFICLVLLIFQNVSISGRATESFTDSNVSITKYIAISFSENLSEGIDFGDVNVLPATSLNATHNYDGLINGTSLYISVSSDSNTPVDFCIKANTDLTSIDLDVIGLANETYQNSSTTNLTLPTTSPEIPLTTSYIKSGDNIAVGSENYYRFWLDVPVAQPSGDYNNTVSFKGVQVGYSC